MTPGLAKALLTSARLAWVEWATAPLRAVDDARDVEDEEETA